MIFKLTSEGCRVSQSSYKHVIKHLDKINQSLPDIESDLVVIRLVIKSNVDEYFPPRRHRLQKTYADTKPELAQYEGSITFRLAKKQIFVHFKGQTIDECIDTGFDLIFKKLEKYKDTHFPSESQYPDRRTIRKLS
jgi:hypothetical protein